VTNVLSALNQALHDIMETTPEVYVLGEDILDPYGGAFKVTKGLSTRFPDRVLTTPISEGAIVGVATGMAMRGMRPVVEIMFGDFLMLTADQLVNHASKFRWMYNDQVKVPIVVRTPMGGRRGYGATHSQTLEKIFLGIPGLRTVAVNTLIDPGHLLRNAVLVDDPVLFIEHKLLYARPLIAADGGELDDYDVELHGRTFPTAVLRFKDHTPQVTIACYGHMFEIVRQVAMELVLEWEVFCEIVLFSQLSPFSLKPLEESVARTRRLLVVEEGSRVLGWGAEVLSRLAEGDHLMEASSRVGALDVPIANAKVLEDMILPSGAAVRDAVLALAGRGAGAAVR
jgi:pyruvate/2-oxoglutarate/acetoin dehydrogenase E1 component